MSGWLETLAADTAADPQRKRSCILLWMNGGPSQMDTFDLKPGHANGGPFRAIDTSAPGLRISEHLPTVAKYGHRMAVIRGMTTKEADHGRATFVMRTGYNPTGPIQYPGIGSLVSKELGADDAPLPNCVTIAPYRFFNPAAYGPGFLGPQYAPLIVGDNVQLRQPGRPGQKAEADYGKLLRVQDVDLPEDVDAAHADARLDLLQQMESDFVRRHPGVAPAEPPDRLRPGRPADAHGGGQGVQPRRGAGGAARRLRPQPVRPGLSAGPAAGRARRAVRGGDAGRRQRRRLGHARPELRRRAQPQRDARPGLGHADGRPGNRAACSTRR